ncbi:MULTISPECIES: hypothetical protein [Nocardiopsis]|uniref:ACGX-repeat peptide n=1 Tax=Nocardiopsis lambiniae TaxID=3075539 RepID=A0ABU2M6E3_9ACTN|nr:MULTISPECIES: hypothetical protein [unclassified Nocardiopsis]MDE3720893.1 hypothetical protein [Nocardiopsis sp. N85]MDT0328231.1 hypothetical protein [Nocardiopsis sp. DSM 44743]
MSEPTTLTPSCCGPQPSAPAAEPEAAASPCCGTGSAATEAGACCDPAAKEEAQLSGAGCC